jgi:small subunit ribosomal protein S5
MERKKENSKRKYQQDGFQEEVLDVRRVARVVAGGKRLSFRATVAVGDPEKHLIGIGVGKGRDVPLAIQKAINEAKKNLISVKVVNETIPFEVSAKYKAAEILLKPAKKGKGIIAGGVVRNILKLAGIPNASAKILGNTGNAILNGRATLLALEKLNS